MSIVDVANLGITESTDELFGHRSYTWRWQVQCDDPKESAYGIATDPRFTQKGFPLVSAEFTDLRAVLVRWSVAKQDADPRIAILTQTFSTDIKFPSGDAGNENAPGESGNGMTPANWPENPLLQPPTIRGYYIRENVPVTRDFRPVVWGGRQIVANTLGEPFIPPIEVAKKFPAIAIGINKATINEAFLLSMQDAVNDAPWRNCAARTVKAECEWHSEYDAQFGSYWRLEWVFVYNADFWNPTKYLNTSFNHLGPVDGDGNYTVKQNTDVYGRPLPTAQQIDINGDLVSPGFSRAAATTDGSTTVVMANTTGVVVGRPVSGTGILEDTTIATVSPGVGFTLSQAATLTSTSTLQFAGADPYYLEFWLYNQVSFGSTPF